MSHLLTLSDMDIEAIEAGLWGLVQERYEHSVEAWDKVAKECPVTNFFRTEETTAPLSQ